MLGEVWAMEYDGEHMLIVEVGKKNTYYGTEAVEYVIVIDSRGKKHSFAKNYFTTIAKRITDKKCPPPKENI